MRSLRSPPSDGRRSADPATLTARRAPAPEAPTAILDLGRAARAGQGLSACERRRTPLPRDGATRSEWQQSAWDPDFLIFDTRGRSSLGGFATSREAASRSGLTHVALSGGAVYPDCREVSRRARSGP